MSAKAVANYFLGLARRDGRSIDPLQMQKLLYLAQGWALSIDGQPLFQDPIEAWEYGPVVPLIYYTLRPYGANPITAPLMLITMSGKIVPAEGHYTPNQREILESVWRSYGHWTGPQLINLTHATGSPWFNAFHNNSDEQNARINRISMKDWFDGLAEKAQAHGAPAQ